MSRATQRQAYKDVQAHAEAYRQRVYAYLRVCGVKGSTDEEGVMATGFNRNTYPPRRTELTQRNLVVDSGRRRKTISGKFAIVWIVAGSAPEVKQVGLL